MNQNTDYGDEEEPPLEGFGNKQENYDVSFEGPCFLKTQNDNFKEHYAMIIGNDLYCYRRKGDKDHRVMHSIKGTFL